MPHDVFICYADPDTPVARAVCNRLEAHGIRCWIVPRDVMPGQDYRSAVDAAIKRARILVLVFSSQANSSTNVAREIEHAGGSLIQMILFRIEDVAPAGPLEAFIGSAKQLDAVGPPLDLHLARLEDTVKRLLESRLPQLPFLHTPGSSPS